MSKKLKKAEGRRQEVEGSIQMGIQLQLNAGNLKKLGYQTLLHERSPLMQTSRLPETLT
jgi:hypothetical protein